MEAFFQLQLAEVVFRSILLCVKESRAKASDAKTAAMRE